MDHLTALPPELLAIICKHLCAHCSRPDRPLPSHSWDMHPLQASLAALCRSSRRLHDICQPFLYHFYSAHGISWVWMRLMPVNDPKFQLFLRSILENPGLARHVRVIRFIRVLDQPGVGSVQRAVSMMNCLRNSSVTFPALERLMIYTREIDWDIFRQNDAILARAPNVKKLDIFHCVPPAIEVESGQFQFPIPSLQQLTLHNIHFKYLTSILAAQALLSGLSLTSWVRFRSWDTPSFVTAIEKFANTLEWLALVCTAKDEFPEFIIPSLRSFNRLRVLAIDQITVYGYLNIETNIPTGRLLEFLPPSIEEVDLFYASRLILEDLKSLAIEAPHRLPRLKIVRLRVRDHVQALHDLPEMESELAALKAIKIRVYWPEEDKDGLAGLDDEGLVGARHGGLYRYLEKFPLQHVRSQDGDGTCVESVEVMRRKDEGWATYPTLVIKMGITSK